ncbi:transcriptional regulator [Streptomyces sp. NPDC054847]
MPPQPAPSPRPARAPEAGAVPGHAHAPALADLLQVGPFSEALRAAVTVRGLPLSRLENRLRLRGVPISAATISSWQSGRHRPERPHALAALAVLEEVLDVAPGALAALLAPPKPRGRWLNSVARRPSMSDAWSGRLDTALSGIETRWTSHLTCLSRHHRMEVDHERRAHLMWNRLVLRAESNGPDRYVIGYRADRPSPPPVVRAGNPRRLGVVHSDPEEGALAAELMLDRPLERGETVIVEYTLEHVTARPQADEAVMHLQGPVRDCAVEVLFDPDAVPVRCYSFSLQYDGEETQRPLPLTADGYVHVVGLDLAPCAMGIRWQWSP